jgi:hypothetical protein
MACDHLNRNVQVLGRSYVRVDDLVSESRVKIVISLDVKQVKADVGGISGSS